jgi:hypothetical protein
MRGRPFAYWFCFIALGLLAVAAVAGVRWVGGTG